MIEEEKKEAVPAAIPAVAAGIEEDDDILQRSHRFMDYDPLEFDEGVVAREII